MDREQYLVDAWVAEEREKHQRMQDEKVCKAATELEVAEPNDDEELLFLSSLDRLVGDRRKISPTEQRGIENEPRREGDNSAKAVGISLANFDVNSMLPSADGAYPSKSGPPIGEVLGSKDGSSEGENV